MQNILLNHSLTVNQLNCLHFIMHSQRETILKFASKYSKRDCICILDIHHLKIIANISMSIFLHLLTRLSRSFPLRAPTNTSCKSLKRLVPVSIDLRLFISADTSCVRLEMSVACQGKIQPSNARERVTEKE